MSAASDKMNIKPNANQNKNAKDKADWHQVGDLKKLLETPTANQGQVVKVSFLNPNPYATVMSIVVTKSSQRVDFHPYHVSVNLGDAFKGNTGQAPYAFHSANSGTFESYSAAGLGAELSLNLTNNFGRLNQCLGALDVPQPVIAHINSIQQSVPFLKIFHTFHNTILEESSDAKSMTEKLAIAEHLMEQASGIMKKLSPTYLGTTQFDQKSDLYFSILEYCCKYGLKQSALSASDMIRSTNVYRKEADRILNELLAKPVVFSSGAQLSAAATATATATAAAPAETNAAPEASSSGSGGAAAKPNK